MIAISFISFFIGLGFTAFGWQNDLNTFITIGTVSFGLTAFFLYVSLSGIGSKVVVDGPFITYFPLFGGRKNYTFSDIHNMSYMGRNVRLHFKGKIVVFCPTGGHGYFLLKAKELGIGFYCVRQEILINTSDRSFNAYYSKAFNDVKCSFQDATVVIRGNSVRLHFKDKKGIAREANFRRGKLSTEYLLMIAKESGTKIESY
jgi:hypothetical protein